MDMPQGMQYVAYVRLLVFASTNLLMESLQCMPCTCDAWPLAHVGRAVGALPIRSCDVNAANCCMKYARNSMWYIGMQRHQNCIGARLPLWIVENRAKTMTHVIR